MREISLDESLSSVLDPLRVRLATKSIKYRLPRVGSGKMGACGPFFMLDDPPRTASTLLVFVSLTVSVATTSRLATVSSVEIHSVAAAYEASIITVKINEEIIEEAYCCLLSLQNPGGQPSLKFIFLRFILPLFFVSFF